MSANFISAKVDGFACPSSQNGIWLSPSMGLAPALRETAWTPGMASSLSLIWRQMARTAFGEPIAGIDTCAVSTFWESNPGSTLQILARLRIISPAPGQQDERERHFNN